MRLLTSWEGMTAVSIRFTSSAARRKFSAVSSPPASTQSPPTKFCSVLTVVATAPLPSDPFPRLVQHLAHDADHLVELLRPGDERRRELCAGLAAVVEAHVDAELARPRRQERLDEVVALGGRERLLRLLVLHELERVEVAVAAHVADHRVLGEELVATRLQLGPEPLRPPDEVLPLEDLEVGERDRARNSPAAA